jgi:glycosyltransferase involved in cell wall biosynthesis
MSVYNGEKYLREAIDSILKQTFTDFEFLIIDDTSTDRTSEILQSYNDPRIKIIRNSENLGLTKSLNIGLGLAEGEYIARMDADDVSLPDRFIEEVRYLDDHPDVALVGTGREVIDEEGIFIETIIPPNIVSVESLLKKNPFQHSSVMFRKDLIVKVGGYCTLMQCCQDYYLWLKLIRNHHLHNIPKVLSNLRIQKNSISNKKIRESALSHIYSIRIFYNLMKESDICYDLNSIQLSNNEKIYYLNRLAESHRINNNFKDARKIYLQIIFINPGNIISITNYFRMFIGKNFISKTTKIYLILKHTIRYNQS